MWIEWTIATRFLREGRVQSTLILVDIAVGVAVIVFLTALITGLQSNIINRTLGTQAHIKVQPTQESNHILPPAEGSTQLLLESRRTQRLLSNSSCAMCSTRCRMSQPCRRSSPGRRSRGAARFCVAQGPANTRVRSRTLI